jgi:hypothetical protein
MLFGKQISPVSGETYTHTLLESQEASFDNEQEQYLLRKTFILVDLDGLPMTTLKLLEEVNINIQMGKGWDEIYDAVLRDIEINISGGIKSIRDYKFSEYNLDIGYPVQEILKKHERKLKNVLKQKLTFISKLKLMFSS